MDARTDLDSEETRAPPPSFLVEAQRVDTGTGLRHDPPQRHRGSSQSDGREVQGTPQHLPPRSSPAAASVDSFSSYINKDAALFQNRSSSPRPEDQLRDRSDPASQTDSPGPQPRHLVTTPVVSRDAFRHQHWREHDAPRASSDVMSIEHLHTGQLSRQLSEHVHVDDNERDCAAADNSTPVATQDYHHQHVAASHSPAIDVNRLSVSNLAQKNQEDDDADPKYRDAHSRAAASIFADDSFESTASVIGDDSKNEIRRRRRTRPDEANLLAQVYAKNPFPDHETRLFLANRVGMSVRAVSVWFQNRRQAEKKRSGRYGGASIGATGAACAPTNGQVTPAVNASPLRPSANAVPMQRKPLGNASANAAGSAKRFDPQELNDLSSNNKENIPPWLVGRNGDGSLQRHLERAKLDVPLAALSKSEALAPHPARDLRQAVGPEGVGITAYRVEDDTAPVQTAKAADVSTQSKTSLSRHRSVPRLSLDDVLSGRSQTLRRSATEHAAPLTAAASSELEEEHLDTILPPPKLLSRASSSSSLSLLTTSGGRASIGNLDLRKEASPLPQTRETKLSLTSSLPPKLTAALQRQGIIAMQSEADEQRGQGHGLLQMMPSSSASSSEADGFYNNEQHRESEEDEERTLKMIAQRRAAKAQAAALAEAQAARERAAASTKASATGAVPMDARCADARQAIVQQAGSSSCSAVDATSIGNGPKKAASTVVGLAPARQLSLDWAAGRDRASTSALPTSIGGTPLSRSVSARQLSLHRRDESVSSVQHRARDSVASTGEKQRKSSSSASNRRSLSATDLTRRLQDAKRKGDAAKGKSGAASRKRPAAALEVRDENIDPATATAPAPPTVATGVPSQGSVAMQPAKRRRAQLEKVALSSSLPEPVQPPKAATPFPARRGAEISPMLPSRPFVPHASFPSASRAAPTMVIPVTPQGSGSLYGAGAAIPLSTRSDRFRAIGASPAASTLGRSISANYPAHRQHHHNLPRSSAARDQAPNRGWDHARSYSGSTGEDGWTPHTVRAGVSGMESLSQPLALTASTPSRVLGDRTNFGTSTPSMAHHTHGSSSVDSPFMHDDSGFFGSFSEDEEHQEHVIRASNAGAGAGKKTKLPGLGAVSPRKASLRSMAREGTSDNGDDHQAAELLLGLGKSVGSRDSSSSQ